MVWQKFVKSLEYAVVGVKDKFGGPPGLQKHQMGSDRSVRLRCLPAPDPYNPSSPKFSSLYAAV